MYNYIYTLLVSHHENFKILYYFNSYLNFLLGKFSNFELVRYKLGVCTNSSQNPKQFKPLHHFDLYFVF